MPYEKPKAQTVHGLCIQDNTPYLVVAWGRGGERHLTPLGLQACPWQVLEHIFRNGEWTLQRAEEGGVWLSSSPRRS